MLDKKELADFLRTLAKRIEQGDVPLSERKQENRVQHEVNGFFDVNVPEEIIKEELTALDINSLKDIVNMHKLDPKSTVRKWKDKDKIIDFIIERRKGLINRFKGF